MCPVCSLDRFSRLVGQFELDQLPRLLLHDRCPGNYPTAMRDIAYLEFDEIAAPKLAVDGQIEKGKISGTLGPIAVASGSPRCLGVSMGVSARSGGPCSTGCDWHRHRHYLRCCTWCVSSILSGETQVWIIIISSAYRSWPAVHAP